MEETYRKVYIKSKDDLPKRGEYFVHLKTKEHNNHNWWIYNPDWDTKLWLENIDWYLQPIEQDSNTHFFDNSGVKTYPNDQIGFDVLKYNADIAMKELDECIKKATPGLSNIKDVDKHLDEIRGISQPSQSAEKILSQHIDKESMDELSENIWPDILEAMEEYASQKHGIELPSEEEINKKIFAICSEMRPWDGKSYQKTTPEMLMELVKWIKSQIKK